MRLHLSLMHLAGCVQVVLLGYFVIMGILPVLCLTYLNPPRHPMSIAQYEDPEVGSATATPPC
jgi:hypothetical protein